MSKHRKHHTGTSVVLAAALSLAVYTGFEAYKSLTKAGIKNKLSAGIEEVVSESNTNNVYPVGPEVFPNGEYPAEGSTDVKVFIPEGSGYLPVNTNVSTNFPVSPEAFGGKYPTKGFTDVDSDKTNGYNILDPIKEINDFKFDTHPYTNIDSIRDPLGGLTDDFKLFK